MHGFTDHEQLDAVGLIHMNGRVYDPELGRFLSADPFVQAPLSSQSYNRYSYVFNNPLSFTDPSGFIGTGDRTTREDDGKNPDGGPVEEVVVTGQRHEPDNGVDNANVPIAGPGCADCSDIPTYYTGSHADHSEYVSATLYQNMFGDMVRVNGATKEGFKYHLHSALSGFGGYLDDSIASAKSEGWGEAFERIYYPLAAESGIVGIRLMGQRAALSISKMADSLIAKGVTKSVSAWKALDPARSKAVNTFMQSEG